MATFREMTYMVLDLLKQRSDDAYYTEEHVIFLLGKMRALLLERKYALSRNKSFSTMSDDNLQTICLSLEPTTILPNGCSGVWLKSNEKVPATIGDSEPQLFIANGLLSSPITYIPAERMPYVGYNKWLKKIIYAARGLDGYLYLQGGNPQFIYLEKIKMQGVFASPEDAAALSCEPGNDSGICPDILDAVFPLEDSLISSCIELVFQELSGSRYAPEDKANNAKDDLGEASVVPSKPAKTSSQKNGSEEE